MTSGLDWLRPRQIEPWQPEALRGAAHDSGQQPLLASTAMHPPVPIGGTRLAQLWAAAARAASYATDRPHGAVVCRASALWVHTGAGRPTELEAAEPSGRRLPGSAHRCRAARLDPGDVIVLDGIPVTSLVRTGADLARFWPLDRAASGLLALRRAGLELRDVDALLTSSGARPQTRRARELLDALERLVSPRSPEPPASR